MNNEGSQRLIRAASEHGAEQLPGSRAESDTRAETQRMTGGSCGAARTPDYCKLTGMRVDYLRG
jgi:hypothetical protein